MDYIGALIRQETEAGTEVLFSEILTIVKKQEAKPFENRPTVMMKLNWTGDEPLAASTNTIKLNNINIGHQEKFRNEQRFKHGLSEAHFPIRGTIQDKLDDSLKTTIIKNAETPQTPPNQQIQPAILETTKGIPITQRQMNPNAVPTVVQEDREDHKNDIPQQQHNPDNSVDHQPQANLPSAKQTLNKQSQGAMALQHPLQPNIIEPIIPPMVKFADKSTGQAYNALVTMAAKEDDPQHITTKQEISKKGILGKIFTDNLSNQERQLLGAENVEQINSGQLTAQQLAQVIKTTSRTNIQPQGILSAERTHSDPTPAVYQTPPSVPHDKTFTKDFPDIPSWSKNQEIMQQFLEQSPAIHAMN